MLFMCCLPWSSDFSSSIFYIFKSGYHGPAEDSPGGVIAAILIMALNIAIQPVQMGIRALIVDTCPPHQQAQAMTYASCITGVGSIVGYALGFVELPQWLPWFGNTQFKCLSVAASLALGLVIAVSMAVVTEKKVVFDIEKTDMGIGVTGVVRQVLRTVKLMSTDMKTICKVQFFAWMGWFPFLNYVTT